VPSRIEIHVVERCAGGAASGSGSRVALLKADVLPIDRDELEEYFRRMNYSRKDLLELVSTVPDDILSFHPDRRQRTIREILQHIAGAEQWYVTRLLKIPRFPPQKTPLQRLQLVRDTAYAYLSQQNLQLSARVVEKAGESWTLRKVLRRFLEHEREHILEIEWCCHDVNLSAFSQLDATRCEGSRTSPGRSISLLSYLLQAKPFLLSALDGLNLRISAVG